MGFAIRNSIAHSLDKNPLPINDRIMTMRIPLQKKCFLTIARVYATTLTNPDQNKEEFYSNLRETIKNVPINDKLIISGDFSARIETKAENWPGVIGTHCTSKSNLNGELLSALCSKYELIITNTEFKHKQQYRTT